jgi:hypothetical protein
VIGKEMLPSRLLSAAIATVVAVVLLVMGHMNEWSVPESVVTQGRVVPAAEWVLVKNEDGTLTTMLYDYAGGSAQSYSVSQFERGDAVEFSLNAGIIGNGPIRAGDTIGSIRSNESERRLAQLRGQLTTAIAALNLSQSGQKEADVAVAERRLSYAQEQLARQRRIVDRLAPQRERGFISAEEFDEAESALRLHELGISIAEAELESARTGERYQQIDMDRSRIEAIEREIATLERRIDDYTLVSPISGRLRRSFSSDTLLIVSDVSSHIVFMPVRWQDRHRVRVGQTVRVSIPGDRTRMEATVVEIDSAVRTISGQPTVVAVARLENSPFPDVAGISARCVISGTRTPIAIHIERFVSSLLM